MLKEKTLFGVESKIDIAIKRLQHYEPEEGYWVGVSGGKDSDVILELVKMSGVKYEAHHSLTTIDPPEAIHHIKRNLPGVIINSPEVPFLKKLETKGFPTRQGRWCCEIYKERGGDGRRVVLGIRAGESHKRSKRKIFEHCYGGGTSRRNGKTFVSPIIDWSDEDVWEFHQQRGIPHCSLYDEGRRRVGCLMCPIARHSERLGDVERYPKYTKLFIRAFERLFEYKKTRGPEAHSRWNSGEEMFRWWVDEDMPGKPDERQHLFRFDN